MNPDFSKLKQTHSHEQEQAHAHSQHVAHEAKEFASVEDLLRYDSEQNPVPAAVADRVNNSIAAEPKPARSWFGRLFGGSE